MIDLTRLDSKRGPRILTLLTVTLALLLAAQAVHAAIIPVSDSRLVRYTVFGPTDVTTTRTPASPFAPFDENLGSGRATQTSSIDSSGIQGVGSARWSGPMAGTGFVGTSILELVFQVDVARDYELFGTLGSIGEGDGGSLRFLADGVQQLSLTGPSCSSCGTEQFAPFSTTLSLTPGVSYQLRAAVQQGSIEGGGSFDVTLVPEPAVGLLVGLGLAALRCGRRTARGR